MSEWLIMSKCYVIIYNTIYIIEVLYILKSYIINFYCTMQLIFFVL